MAKDARKRERIGKRTVDAAVPTGSDSFTWDSELRGFGLRVSAKGRKSFVVQYRAGRKSRRITLGAANVLTAKQARTRAREILAEVAGGGDPVEERRQKANEITVAELADRYIEDHAKLKKKPDGAREDERALRKRVLPAIGHIPVSEVRFTDLDRLHASMRKTPVLANRVHALCSKMFGLSEQWDLRPHGSNPSRGIQRYKEKPRHVDISLEELASIGNALREMAEEGEDSAAIDALVCISLTGCRKSEITKLTWSEVDLTEKRLNLRDSKTGPKSVPLPDDAAAIIAARERSGTLVFPSRRTGRVLSLWSVWERIRKRTGLADVRIHDLRHNWGNTAADAGHGLPQVGVQLGQTTQSVTAIYSRARLASAAEMSNAVASKIHAALSAAPDADVIELRPGS